MRTRLLLSLCLSAGLSFAQVRQMNAPITRFPAGAQVDASLAGQTFPARFVSSLPVSCTVGEIAVLTSTSPYQAQICGATNTWSSLGGVSSFSQLSGTVTLAQLPSGVMPDYRVYGQAKLPIWRNKLASVATGTSDARVLFIGDSTTWGAYSANWPANTTSSGWPALMSKMFPSSTPVSNASATTQGLGGGADSRVVLSGAFINTNIGGGFGHQTYSVNGTGSLVFTPGDGVSYDSFTIYTQGGLGGGTISATATGGSATNIVQAYSNTVVKTTVTAASAGTSNAVTLSWVSGTSVQVLGIEAFNSTVRRVRFANAGISGSATSAWADSATSIIAIKAWAPDLTVIMLGINDAQSNVTTATYLANIQAMVTAAKLSGDVIVMSSVPSDPSLASTVTLEAAYAAALPSLAGSNNIVFMDLFNRFGGAFVSPMMTNTLHPNPAGYFDIASFVNSYLNPPGSGLLPSVVDPLKLGNGDVDATHLSTIKNVTSDVQSQFNTLTGKFTTAGTIAVDGVIYTTIQAAETAACAASPIQDVTVPPTYAGTDWVESLASTCGNTIIDQRKERLSLQTPWSGPMVPFNRYALRSFNTKIAKMLQTPSPAVQLSWMTTGDSVADNSLWVTEQNLQSAFPTAGFGLGWSGRTAGNISMQGLTFSNSGDVIVNDGNTVAYNYTYWPTGTYSDIGATGSVAWGSGGSYYASDTFKVFYIIEPGAGRKCRTGRRLAGQPRNKAMWTSWRIVKTR
jgi:lysophospholipase L1-like esterase